MGKKLFDNIIKGVATAASFGLLCEIYHKRHTLKKDKEINNELLDTLTTYKKKGYDLFNNEILLGAKPSLPPAQDGWRESNKENFNTVVESILENITLPLPTVSGLTDQFNLFINKTKTLFDNYTSPEGDKFSPVAASGRVNNNLEKLTNTFENLINGVFPSPSDFGRYKGEDFLNQIFNLISSPPGWKGFTSQLTFDQLNALGHILSSFTILLCLITIMTIVYGDILLDNFKLEVKFPKLAKFIKLRKTFRLYYLFINFSIILLLCLSIIFVDLQAFVS